MAWYRATSTGFLPGNRRVEKDAIFQWEGPKGLWMEPCDAPRGEVFASPSAEPAAYPAKPIEASAFFAGPPAVDPDRPVTERPAPRRRKAADQEGAGE